MEAMFSVYQLLKALQSMLVNNPLLVFVANSLTAPKLLVQTSTVQVHTVIELMPSTCAPSERTDVVTIQTLHLMPLVKVKRSKSRT